MYDAGDIETTEVIKIIDNKIYETTNIDTNDLQRNALSRWRELSNAYIFPQNLASIQPRMFLFSLIFSYSSGTFSF